MSTIAMKSRQCTANTKLQLQLQIKIETDEILRKKVPEVTLKSDRELDTRMYGDCGNCCSIHESKQCQEYLQSIPVVRSTILAVAAAVRVEGAGLVPCKPEPLAAHSASAIR